MNLGPMRVKKPTIIGGCGVVRNLKAGELVLVFAFRPTTDGSDTVTVITNDGIVGWLMVHELIKLSD